jgi:hypothetical protein
MAGQTTPAPGDPDPINRAARGDQWSHMHGPRRPANEAAAARRRHSAVASPDGGDRTGSRQAHVRTAPRPWRDPVPAWPDSIRGSRGSLLGETCVHCNACSSRVSPRARDHNRTPVSRATSAEQRAASFDAQTPRRGSSCLQQRRPGGRYLLPAPSVLATLPGPVCLDWRLLISHQRNPKEFHSVDASLVTRQS